MSYKSVNPIRRIKCKRCGKRISGNPDWVHTCTLPEGYERKFSTVTVPENKLTELQIKASQRDELLEALELLIDDLALRAKLRGDDCLDVSDGRLYKAQKAIAKAKGENK